MGIEAEALYRETFRRNAGVLGEAEQARIRSSRILIVGCGGVGSLVAACLARSGVERFTLVDFDTFEVSNLNRQICATRATLGRPKVDCLREHIADINPKARVETYGRLLTLEELEPLVEGADLVFPAADDFAFSLMLFSLARRKGKTALMVVPCGLWALVGLLGPEGPSAWDFAGLPERPSYAEAKRLLESPEYRRLHLRRMRAALVREDYLEGYHDEGKSPPQLCPLVWTASSLGALEALSFLSREEEPKASSVFWELGPRGIFRRNPRGPSLFALELRLSRWRLRRSLAGRE